MKKLSILFLSVVAMTAAFTSCSKNDSPAAPATSLVLTVTDQTGTATPGVTVVLFDSTTATTPVATGTTDASGIVTFKTGLKAITYYFNATSTGDGNCYNNEFTGYATTADGSVVTGGALTAAAPIKAGVVNNQKVVVFPVGTVSFTNNTTSGCNVYYATNSSTGVAGTYNKLTTTALAAGATTSATDFPTFGTFSIQFRPVDASTGTESTDQSTWINITQPVTLAPCAGQTISSVAN